MQLLFNVNGLQNFICSCSFDFALPVFTDLDFQSIWEFRKIGKYSLGKYLNIPSLNLFEKWEKL